MGFDASRNSADEAYSFAVLFRDNQGLFQDYGQFQLIEVYPQKMRSQGRDKMLPRCDEDAVALREDDVGIQKGGDV